MAKDENDFEEFGMQINQPECLEIEDENISSHEKLYRTG